MSAVQAMVIVTRAEPGAAETCARAAQAGYQVISSPMLEIAADDRVALNLDGVAHLALTSANGVRAFAARSDRRDLIAWCVGPATHDAARKAGFTDIREGAGDADDLADLILAEQPVVTGRVLHVANAAAAGNLLQRLMEGGVDVEFVPLYQALPVPVMSDAARDYIQSGGRGFVLVHSAKGAEAFGAAAGALGLSQLIGVAVSRKAGMPLEKLGLRAIVHAAHPNEDGLFMALETASLAF